MAGDCDEFHMPSIAHVMISKQVYLSIGLYLAEGFYRALPATDSLESRRSFCCKDKVNILDRNGHFSTLMSEVL